MHTFPEQLSLLSKLFYLLIYLYRLEDLKLGSTDRQELLKGIFKIGSLLIS